MKQMLEKEKFDRMVLDIENLIQALTYHLSTIDITAVLNKMGFPKNWKDLKNIERNDSVE